jgi:hypothetical protein
MQPSGPYPNPLGPESQGETESSKPIVAQVGGFGGGVGSTVPLK